MVKQTVMTQLQQLQTASEGAIGKITQHSATRSAVQGAMQLKDRGDKILGGLSSIEDRLTAIEKRLDTLEGKTKGASRGGSTAKPRAAKSKTTKASSAKPSSPSESESESEAETAAETI
jgi:hypothetical protein